MALSYNQYPATCSLVQSPTVFTLKESGQVYTSASFQYYLDLYYWDGTPNNSGSVSNYTLVKYPNASLACSTAALSLAILPAKVSVALPAAPSNLSCRSLITLK